MRKSLFFVLLIFVASCAQNPTPNQSDMDLFAQCIVDSGAKIYSAWWCPHCTQQKKDFGSSWDIIDKGGSHVECSPNGMQSFSDYCKNIEGFQGTPMWQLGDGRILRGRQPLPLLAAETGCSLEQIQ